MEVDAIHENQLCPRDAGSGRSRRHDAAKRSSLAFTSRLRPSRRPLYILRARYMAKVIYKGRKSGRASCINFSLRSLILNSSLFDHGVYLADCDLHPYESFTSRRGVCAWSIIKHGSHLKWKMIFAQVLSSESYARSILPGRISPTSFLVDDLLDCRSPNSDLLVLWFVNLIIELIIGAHCVQSHSQSKTNAPKADSNRPYGSDRLVQCWTETFLRYPFHNT